MTVTVKLFAGLRERAGWSERELDGVSRVGDVWPALGLGPEPGGLLYAVNKEYAQRERELAEGDEVAVIPPVSGGSFRLSAEQLSLDAVVDEVRSDRAGAIATFVGTTRVEIGDASVVIAVSAPHRQDALAACRDAIDTLKEQVPLWKKEVYESGEEWIGRGS